jgi:serralysin
MAAGNWTLDQVLDQLNTGNLWAGMQITYSFPTTSSFMYTGSGEAAGFQAFSGNQITMAEYALAGWDDLIAADFLKTTGFTNIEFGYTTTGIGFAHAYYPSNSSVWFNGTKDLLTDPTIGEYGYETFLHEIGHALGLDHMGNYDASDPQSVHPYSYQDSTVLSVMSYFGPSHFDGEGEVQWADWTKGGISYSVQTPMVNDIMAIQAMYGAETTTRAGNTVYGFNSNITGKAATFYDFDVNGNPVLAIYDSGGIDVLDLSGYSTACNISLVAGSYSDCNEMTYNIGIAYTATIENAVGGSADDTLRGNSVANILTGGGGSDTINGAGGSDIAVFSGDFANYSIVANGNGSYTVTDNVGDDGTDTLTSIEMLRFRDRDVTEGNNDTAPVLATAIDDQKADADTRFTFTIPNGAFTDPNGDTLTYSAKLEGGDALPAWLTFDEVTRTFSGTPNEGDAGTLSIVVTASDGTESAKDTFDIVVGSGGGGNGDDIYGTLGADDLYGTDASERMFGLFGNDDILAGDGDDVIRGGYGSDFIWGEGGADTFAFDLAVESPWKSRKFDVLMDFNSAEGDKIDLSGIDANLLRFGNQTFRFEGSGDGYAGRGQIDYNFLNGNTQVFGYNDRDKNPDFYFQIEGMVDLKASDFVL